MTFADQDQEPWYQQFWPWVLIILPGTVVIACGFTMYLAFTSDDSVVSDNYYKDGLAINQKLEQDLRAKELGLSATVDFDMEVGDVMVKLSNLPENYQTLRLQLLHPGSSDFDEIIQLHMVQPGNYRGELVRVLVNKRYVRISPVGDPDSIEWRLNGTINFDDVFNVELLPE